MPARWKREVQVHRTRKGRLQIGLIITPMRVHVGPRRHQMHARHVFVLEIGNGRVLVRQLK